MAVRFSKVDDKVTYIPIPGTDAWDEDDNNYQWYERGSAFTRHLASQNLILHAVGFLPWSTSLDGIPTRRNHVIWKGAAKHLICHLERVPLHQRNLVAHSHGGNVVFHALDYGLQINNLITVGTPVRADMESVVLRGLANAKYWHHICDSSTDKVSVWGALFDGKFSLRPKHTFDLADGQDDIKGIGHSKILNDEQAIKLWDHDQKGWASLLAYGKSAYI